MRKAIVVKFVKDGEVVAEGEALPGTRLPTLRKRQR
jgi:hypothetical protein